MKNYLTYLNLIALGSVLSLTNCNKENASPKVNTEPTNGNLTLATASPSKLTVETVYGSPYASGALVNGSGTSARFNSPMGVQFIPDGTLFVADMGNNAVRKISATGTVSTLVLKPSPLGAILTQPIYIGVEFNTGTIHIVQDGDSDLEAYDQSWIFKSNGDFVATDYSTYVFATGMARDPYTDGFYFSSGGNITQHIMQPTGEIHGKIINYDPEKLEYPEKEQLRGFTWDAIAIGYNKVVYFTTNGRIYKYTPGGVTERIFTNRAFTKITSMIFNKDSRTMYVADNGYIKRVDSGKLTVLAGPRGTNNGRDGNGLTADVYAFGLALAQGENVLYFTDSKANTIRRIYLK